MLRRVLFCLSTTNRCAASVASISGTANLNLDAQTTTLCNTVIDDYSIASGNDSEMPRHRKKVISRALESYLNDVKAHNRMMARERTEFELGKRHLANIMGLDPNNITQGDIDKAIEYLFPSALTDKRALPVMKPPEEILPKMKNIAFDEEGRPEDLLFYTLFPKFYKLLSNIGWKTEALLRMQYIKGAIGSSSEEKLVLLGTDWMSQDLISKKLEEKVSDEMYAHLLMAFNFLISLPNAYQERDFIFEYRKSVASNDKSVIYGPEVPPVQLLEGTDQRMAKASVRLKRTFAEVEVRSNGTGKYTIDGHGIDCFRSLQAREIFFAPLIVTDLLEEVDIAATITEGPGGSSVVPRIVRHGAALGIAALYPDYCEKLRLAGLLTFDPRRRERKKINQPGARAKWIWKKR